MKRGFTLIEFLIYIGLSAIFLVILTNILVTALETLTESSRQSMVDIDAKYVLSRLAYDVGRATSLAVSAGTLTLDVGTYTLVNGNLMLGSDRLNSFDVVVSNFVTTKIGNGTGKDTVKLSFDLSNGDEMKSLTTTVGLR